MSRSSQSLILFMLITTSVCMDAEWSVRYGPSKTMCGLWGSTIRMRCNYNHPSYLIVKHVRWVDQGLRDYSTFVWVRQRVNTSCDNNKTCFLQLKGLNPLDGLQRYHCMITTYNETKNYIGKPGISLSTTGLEVVKSRNGDNVTLTCNTTCKLPRNLSFSWLKNGRTLKGEYGQKLSLGAKRAGKYTCAVRQYKNSRSTNFILIPSTHSAYSRTPGGATGLTQQFDLPSEIGGGLNRPAAAVGGSLGVVMFLTGLRLALRFLGYSLGTPSQTPEPTPLQVLPASATA